MLRRIPSSARVTAIAVAILAFLPLVAFAAGGGGGGATSCTQDTWTCTDWGFCSIDGEQRRECTKTFDCPSTDTPPAPPGVQRCSPTCVKDDWNCTAWSVCGADRRQRRTCSLAFDCPVTNSPGKPVEEQVCTLDCTGDLWTCSNWSACGRDGYQARTCTAGYDCPDIVTPKPSERQRCTPSRTTTPAPSPVRRTAPTPTPAPTPVPAGESQLVCGNLATLEERVTCRLGLAPEVLERELAAQYLPEECRAISEAITRSTCIARYQSLRPCWSQPIGPLRLACVRGVLGIGDLAEERARCLRETGTRPTACLWNLRARAYPYITFRFYDLEERAEGLQRIGAPTDLVARFVLTAERAKQDFNAARTTDERVAVIRRVQSAWRDFVQAIPEAVRTKARTEGIGSSH